MMEKPFVTLVNLPYCSNCSGSTKNYGSPKEHHVCGWNANRGPRTKKLMLKTQAMLLRDRQIRGLKGRSDKRAASYGMNRYDTCNQLLYFEFLFGVGEVYDAVDFDFLHSFLLGLVPRLLNGVDNLFTRYHKKMANLTTREDTRQLVETFLHLIPPISDGAHRLRLFQGGWWTLLSWGGGDYEALLMQLLFLFSTNDVLIEDEAVRAELACVVRLAFSFFRKLKMKKRWRKSEISVLHDDLLDLYARMSKLFRLDLEGTEEEDEEECESEGSEGDLSEDEEGSEGDGSEDEDTQPGSLWSECDAADGPLLPGQGIRVPKMHALTRAAHTVYQQGSVHHCSTAMYERLHKHLKSSFRRTSKKKETNTQSFLLERHLLEQKLIASDPKALRGQRLRAHLQAQLESISLEEGSDDVDDDDDDDDNSDPDGAPVVVWGAVPSNSMCAFTSLRVYIACHTSGAASISEHAEAYVRSLGSSVRIGSRLKLLRIPNRPGVVLTPGHHVMQRDGSVFLFVAPLVENSTAGLFNRALVIPLVQRQAAAGSKARKRKGLADADETMKHPLACLPWLERLSTDSMKVIDASSIQYRVHVVPAFIVTEDGEVGEDGFLLNHGIFNYSGLRHEQRPP
mmetsp:Transcript_54268/g.107747  ORF Transcript_54268/g.107747 Transcript_54268/m.107747 type:complete len:624 (+) Transcript_54268:64-1935(+)